MLNSSFSKLARPLKKFKTPVPEDIEISQASSLMDIKEFGMGLGLNKDEVVPYGGSAAKIKLSVLDRLKDSKEGKFIVVTGINPTSFGEGKTTTVLGLSQAIGAHLGRNVFSCIRQPSSGPTFGVKGGAAGGGYSQAIPMESFNLHLTGDLHAITAANNLIAAAIDTRYFHEKTIKSHEKFFDLLCPKDSKTGLRKVSRGMQYRLEKLGITDIQSTTDKDLIQKFCYLNIDPSNIPWRRVLDVNDRLLREITIGQGQEEKNITRKTGFDITVSSELMAILALTNDLQEMRKKIGQVVVAFDTSGNPICADDLGVAGAATVLMKDTIMPNLMQSLEGTPVMVHAGPFANIAHGNSSIVADKVALKLVGPEGFVLTECGFGSDIGFEKFANIKCRYSGRSPDGAVLVVSIRALKLNGGSQAYKTENVEAVKRGVCNMTRHIENIQNFGVPCVVVVNEFSSDTMAEIAVVKDAASKAGAAAVVLSSHWAKGGLGAVDAAKTLIEVLESQKPKFKFSYELSATIPEKIETICKQVYGAGKVEYSEKALKSIDSITRNGFANLPICNAKTQYSLSADPTLLGSPTGFNVKVEDVKASVGAGLIVVFLGEIKMMPGLPVHPAYYEIDVDVNGEVVGLH